MRNIIRFFAYSILLSFVLATITQTWMFDHTGEDGFPSGIRPGRSYFIGNRFVSIGNVMKIGNVIYTYGDSRSLSNALALAMDGDIVVVEPGVWLLEEPLGIPSGVTFRGTKDQFGNNRTRFIASTFSTGLNIMAPFGDRSYCSPEAFPPVHTAIISDLTFDFSTATQKVTRLPEYPSNGHIDGYRGEEAEFEGNFIQKDTDE